MSLAGARSQRGDEYQLRIAMQWIIRLWTDSEIAAVQVESLGIPGDGATPLVDDIVVMREDGRRIYVQAKKNHPDFGVWSLRDRTLRDELTKARDQLERDDDPGRSVARFYSQSPFGTLSKLVEGARDYPDAPTFMSSAPATLTTELHGLAQLWDRCAESAFALARRLEFSLTGDYDELDRECLTALRWLFARPEEVRDLFEERLRSQQSRLRDPLPVFRRSDLETLLAARGHVPSPPRSEAEVLASFVQSSRIGRSWVRDVAGVRIERLETQAVLDAIRAGKRTILLTGEPGIGKTCVLLDVADALERDPALALLFIKGDRFGGAETAADLVKRGLPDDIAGRCARLAVYRPVVIIVDALDVLSLQRGSATLGLLMGLIDQLSMIPRVTVVAACRTFDLQFDPLLRGRVWDERIMVGSLDIERDVTPLLHQWGVSPGQLEQSLLELLRVPGRLWLYGQLVEDGPVARVGSAYELHGRFLDGIEREPGWGPQAGVVLARIAERMQERRTLELSRSELDAPADVLQGLLSRGALVETERGYAFGHQEMLDVVVARTTQRRGERLHDFVTRHPALPFLRPTVRVFLHVLRSESPVQFSREVWALASDQRVAYHLRRLVVETLAEFPPEASDSQLVRRLLREEGDLFERFLQRTVGIAWLDVIVEDLLPTVRDGEHADHWTHRLLAHLSVWAAARPDVVIPLWRRAVEQDWPGSADLAFVVSRALEHSLREVDREQMPWQDAEWLIRHLLLSRHAEHDPFMIGPVVQAWIEAGGCDEVLLDFLALEGTIPGADPALERRVRSLRERGEPSAMPRHLLAARMVASDAVMDAVLAYALREAADESRGFRRGILNETSWRGRHNRGIMPHSAFNDVLRAMEDALVERAARQDAWWMMHEQLLLTHVDAGIRYLALQSLRHDPETHIAAISAVLTNPETFEHRDLDSEVRELAHAAYPFVSDEVARVHQALILTQAERQASEDENGWARYHRRNAYGHLIWIPLPYRTPDAQAFIDAWKDEFGLERPTPRIYMSGGFVASPVSAEQFQGLSDTGVVRVVAFFGTSVDTRDLAEGLGDWRQVVGSLKTAAMNVPWRALCWLDALLEADAPVPYRNACVEGISLHLRVRFAGLNVSGRWAPAEPLPDGQQLSATLLDLLDRYRGEWLDENTLVEGVEACAHVLEDAPSTARLVRLLAELARSPNPDGTFQQKPGTEALNSTRGKAASAAILVAARIAEAEQEPSQRLDSLLHHFAGDPRPGVRWAVLQGLAPLTYSRPERAWTLFSQATREADGELWEAAEASLYYNYHQHFERVKPLLERIQATSLDAAGMVYGRIAALALLSGHMEEAELFDVLSNAPPQVWTGVAQVLAGNLAHASVRQRCEAALVRLLGTSLLPDEAIQEVAATLSSEESRRSVPRRVVEALQQSPPDREEYTLRTHAVVEWAVGKVVQDPEGVLGVLEQLAAGLEAGRFRRLWGGRDLALVLAALMRDADQMDDAIQIRRVVALQDRLLRLGVAEVDEMLDAASRP